MDKIKTWRVWFNNSQYEKYVYTDIKADNVVRIENDREILYNCTEYVDHVEFKLDGAVVACFQLSKIQGYSLIE